MGRVNGRKKSLFNRRRYELVWVGAAVQCKYVGSVSLAPSVPKSELRVFEVRLLFEENQFSE